MSKRRKKGFTLVELLVVIAIIALLMGILMPALARVRAIAFRMTCGTNLSGMGKAMLIYANDYDDELPRAGYGSTTVLVKNLPDWRGGDEHTRVMAYGPSPGSATLSSSLYLLVKFAEVTPKSFVCKSDSGTSEFKLSRIPDLPAADELVDEFDFGKKLVQSDDNDRGSDMYCSYSYHHPYCLYTLTTSSDPGMAVAADRNPWVRSISGGPRSEEDWFTFQEGVENNDSNKQKKGNATAHQEDGQNVLFVDGHVSFERVSFCGVDEDNIYTPFTVTTDNVPIQDIRIGIKPNSDGGDRLKPGNRYDSYLLGNEQGIPE